MTEAVRKALRDGLVRFFLQSRSLALANRRFSNSPNNQ